MDKHSPQRAKVHGPKTEQEGKDPLSIVNAAGFAFQLAVEEIVRLSTDRHGWTITSREHGWRNADDTPRFIDLVLTRGPVHLVIECKRHRGAQWVFLVPDPPKGRKAEVRRHFRTTYLRNEDSPVGREAITSLSEFQLEPTSWESSFCAVPGASERDPPMLDRICAELTRSTDAIIAQQRAIDGRTNRHHLLELPDERKWVAMPVIVTTADLRVCRFDPAAVPLDIGEIPAGAAHLEQVPVMRYRKSFDVESQPGSDGIGALEKYAQRTVSIVTATHLAKWLEEFNLQPASYA